ncbi:uncharacterized protein LOC123547721 [Mercenaria mercenaria]|uniref:uncharacterized protein LOC123547721 n=1 Tax=Mercenaria mercenaria TaxID=6596 RepID=UPI001E1D67D8|nr:uncharacterized protein LOC123547721 [Mercenaria mercenaria]
MSDGCYTSLNASSAVTERDELIREYFFAGYTYSEIITILNRRHGTTISLRQLSRRLRLLGLRRHNMPGNEGTVIEAIRREIEGSGSSLGYRAMTRRLLSSHGIVASRQTVAAVQRELDPEGVRLRQHRQFTRRIYINKGPNYLVHIDGYDKLKPYGFPIHGAICGFSRKILWLKVARSNNDPKVVATLFLEYLNAINGVPRCIRTDAGTENVLVQDMQMAFRWEHSDDMSAERSVIIGSSHSNQRIERWWLSNRQGGCQYWIDFFKDMENAGLLSTSDELHM